MPNKPPDNAPLMITRLVPAVTPAPALPVTVVTGSVQVAPPSDDPWRVTEWGGRLPEMS